MPDMTALRTTGRHDVRVSVVMATFNRQGYIAEAIDSMLRQTRPIDEIIVVDDGSTDETAKRVLAFGDRIRYIHKENGGKASALNLGLQHCVGDWVWFFDDDDVALPDALQRMLGAISEDDQASFAYSGQIIGSDGPDGRIVKGRTVPLPRVMPDQLFHYALKEFPFLCQGMLIHRRCFSIAGVFDPRYFRGQDYEFCLRLLRNFRGVPVKGPTFVWRVHEGPRGPKEARHHGAERGKVWMQFAAMMGRELRTQLPLGDYLRMRRGADDLEPGLRRRALVHRMAVMASKGLIPEMLEDLRMVADVAASSPDSGFGADEARACWHAVTHEYFLRQFQDSSTLVDDVIRASHGSAGDVLAYMARGMLWAARHGELPVRVRWRLVVQGLKLAITSGRWPRRVWE